MMRKLASLHLLKRNPAKSKEGIMVKRVKIVKLTALDFKNKTIVAQKYFRSLSDTEQKRLQKCSDKEFKEFIKQSIGKEIKI